MKSFLNFNDLTLSRSFHILVPVSLFLLNFILKLFGININPLTLDEPYSVFHAQLPVGEIVTELSKGNNPPLFEILLHLWIRLFGNSELSVRLPSVIFSSISAGLLYLIARRFYSPLISVYPALLFIFSYAAITYALEARVYSLFMMLVFTSSYFFLKLTEEKKNKNKLILGFVNALMLYAHYLGFLLIIAQFTSVIFFKEISKRAKINYFFSFIISLLLFIPYSGPLINRLSDPGSLSWVPATNYSGQFLVPFSEMLNGSNLLLICLLTLAILILLRNYIRNRSFTHLFILGAGCIVLLIAFTSFYYLPFFSVFFSTVNPVLPFIGFMFVISALIITRSHTDIFIRYFFLLSVLPTLLLFCVSFYIPLFIPKYVNVFVAGIYLILPYVFMLIIRKKEVSRLLLLPVLLLFISNWKPVPEKTRPDREVALTVKEIKEEGDIIYVAPYFYEYTFLYHFNREVFSKPGSVKQYLDDNRIYFVSDPRGLAYSPEKGSKVIYVDAAAKYLSPDSTIFSALKKQYRNHHPVISGDVYSLHAFSD